MCGVRSMKGLIGLRGEVLKGLRGEGLRSLRWLRVRVLGA